MHIEPKSFEQSIHDIEEANSKVRTTISSLSSKMISFNSDIRGVVSSNVNEINNLLNSVQSRTFNLSNNLNNIYNDIVKIETSEVESSDYVNTASNMDFGFSIDALNARNEEIDNSQIVSIIDEIKALRKKIAEDPENSDVYETDIQNKINELLSMGIVLLSNEEIIALCEMGYSDFRMRKNKDYLTVEEYVRLAYRNENFKATYDFLSNLNITEDDKYELLCGLLSKVTINSSGTPDFDVVNGLTKDYKRDIYTQVVNNFMVDKYPPYGLKDMVGRMLSGEILPEDEKGFMTGYLNCTLSENGNDINYLFDLGISQDDIAKYISEDRQKSLGIGLLTVSEIGYLKSVGFIPEREKPRYLSWDDYQYAKENFLNKLYEQTISLPPFEMNAPAAIGEFGFFSTTASSSNCTSWKQYGEVWSDTELGDSGKTIGGSGCLATTIAILIAMSGTETTIPDFNPGTFVEEMSDNSGFGDGGDIDLSPLSTIAPNFKYKGEIEVAGLSQDKKYEKIREYVSKGYYLAVEVEGDTGQHWVAIRSVEKLVDEDGNVTYKIIMADPGSQSTDMWTKYTWSNTSKFKYFSCAN